MPFLTILPALFGLIEKFVTPTVTSSLTSPYILSLILGALDRSPTGASIVEALEKGVGALDSAKKQQLILETDALIAQSNLEAKQIEENEQAETLHKLTPRDFLFWGLSCSLLMSVLIEPSLNYIMDLMGNGHIPAVFMMPNIVITLVASLCGIHMGLDHLQKMNDK